MTATPAAKPAKADVRFHVTITDSGYTGRDMTQYRHFTATAGVLAPDKYATDSTTPTLQSPGDYGIDGARADELKGLTITAQADDNSMKTPGREWYGWTVAYDRHRIELADAEQVIPVLRRIKRRMDKLTRELGNPATLAQFATYAASAVTTERSPFLRAVPAAQDFAGTGYHEMDANGLTWHLNSDATEWRKNHGIDPA